MSFCLRETDDSFFSSRQAIPSHRSHGSLIGSSIIGILCWLAVIAYLQLERRFASQRLRWLRLLTRIDDLHRYIVHCISALRLYVGANSEVHIGNQSPSRLGCTK